MVRNTYTFGDGSRASLRLRRLAALYERDTRTLLARRPVRTPRVAVDLGCGPGWSTRLLAGVTRARRVVGLDASARYVAEARNGGGSGIAFHVHDVTRRPFPGPRPDLLLCRFLLTHLREPGRALAAWARVAAPGGCLLVHETENLEAEHPAIRRYYRLVEQLQARYGQRLHVGAEVEPLAAAAGWTIVSSRSPVLAKPAVAMAALHAENLRTWRRNPYARRAFDSRELDRLEDALDRIAVGIDYGGLVFNTARQLVAVRPAPARDFRPGLPEDQAR